MNSPRAFQLYQVFSDLLKNTYPVAELLLTIDRQAWIPRGFSAKNRCAPTVEGIDIHQHPRRRVECAGQMRDHHIPGDDQIEIARENLEGQGESGGTGRIKRKVKQAEIGMGIADARLRVRRQAKVFIREETNISVLNRETLGKEKARGRQQRTTSEWPAAIPSDKPSRGGS